MSTRNAIVQGEKRLESAPRHKCRDCPARFKKQRLLLAHRRTEHKYFAA